MCDKTEKVNSKFQKTRYCGSCGQHKLDIGFIRRKNYYFCKHCQDGQAEFYAKRKKESSQAEK